uniref:Uncharacterized protein n=1 Tax=Anguilla anguilla TaxID=7936 RepID=A0A0E9XVR1_ANGAN
MQFLICPLDSTYLYTNNTLLSGPYKMRTKQTVKAWVAGASKYWLA